MFLCLSKLPTRADKLGGEADADEEFQLFSVMSAIDEVCGRFGVRVIGRRNLGTGSGE